MRGMLAGLGASASLAAAGALALLVLSAVIALEGFPGMNPDAGGRRLAVADLAVGTTDPTTAAVAPDRLAAADRGPAASPAAAAPGPGDGAQDPAVTPPAPGDADQGATPPAGVVPDTGDGRDPGDGPGPVTAPGEDVDRRPLPLPIPLSDEPVSDLTDTTGGLVGDTGERLAPLVEAILPGSGRLVRGTTALLDETVRDTGEALDGTVEVLLDD